MMRVEPKNLPPGPWRTHAPYESNALDVMSEDGIIAFGVPPAVADLLIRAEREASEVPLTVGRVTVQPERGR